MVYGTKLAFSRVVTHDVHTSVKGVILWCNNPGSMEELPPFKTFAPEGSCSWVLMKSDQMTQLNY